LALRDGRHLDRPPSLSGHCGHGPIFILQRSVANDPLRSSTARRSSQRKNNFQGYNLWGAVRCDAPNQLLNHLIGYESTAVARTQSI
jgi:hypothetical protein